MASPKRPYFFHSRLKDLREVFAKHWNDPAVPLELIHELSHRSTPSALALLADVQQHGELNDRSVLLTQPVQAELPLPMLQRENGPQTATTPAALRHRPQASLDDRLKPPLRLKRIESLGVAGRPSKHVHNLKADVTLNAPAGMSRLARYAVALDALISDMRRQRQDTRQITLENGVRIPLDRGHTGYSFALTEDAELFEDTRIELHVGAQRIDGQVVSISSGRINTAVDENLGETIAHCILAIDSTALLEVLKERLEKAGGERRALNMQLADSIVSNSGDQAASVTPLPSSTNFRELNEKQKQAIGVALANEVTYLWGLPGTGKTRTLSVLNQGTVRPRQTCAHMLEHQSSCGSGFTRPVQRAWQESSSDGRRADRPARAYRS